MKTLLNSSVCTSNGIEYKLQVMALDEDGRPAKYMDECSPINKFALVDIENDYIMRITEAESLSEAETILLEGVINEE